MKRVAPMAAVLAVAGVLVWRMRARPDHPAPQVAAQSSNASPAVATGPANDARANRPGPAPNQPPRKRPEPAARRSAAYATIDATPEEVEKIEAIEAEGRAALDRIPDDVVGDDRLNAVLLAEQDKADALADLLGERRADWYLKLRADELEPEVNQLLMPPADAGP